MKTISLIAILCSMACDKAQPHTTDATLPDGGKALVVSCPNMNEVECIAYLSKMCPKGYDVVLRARHWSDDGFTLMADCK